MEKVARYIETVLMPAYSKANEEFDGPHVSRREVRDDLRRIVNMLRDSGDYEFPGAISLAEAKSSNRCRICGGRIELEGPHLKERDRDTLLLKYGKEYCHGSCYSARRDPK